VRRSKVLRTSSFRLALVYAGITAVSFLVLFAVVFWSTARFMRHQIDDSVSNEIDEILTDPLAGNPAGLTSVVRGLARHHSGFYYLLQDAGGTALAGNMAAIDPIPGIREWREPSDSGRAHDPGVRGKGVAIDGEYLFVGWSTHQLREMEEMVAGSFMWGFGASIMLALAGGVVAGSRIMRKIDAVSRTSRDIVAGDLSRRVPISSAGDEFDNLAGSINAMLDRIESLMSDLQQVTTDIAHDLRTPVTRLRHRLEDAQRSGAGAGELREALADTVRDVDGILGIFNALLRIAQIESGARRAGFGTVDLTEVLETAAELYRPSAEEKGHSFSAVIAEGLQVKGDRELLLQLFANLIDNAIRHSPPRSIIALRAMATGSAASVVLEDNGSGIPPPLREKVLQRFVRLENSRTTPGSGLGLSLANAVIKLHEATMTLSDSEPGLRVTVILPGLGARESSQCAAGPGASAPAPTTRIVNEPGTIVPRG
jgi:signal transduction histidine kinase